MGPADCRPFFLGYRISRFGQSAARLCIASRITIARSPDSTRFRGRSKMIRFATISFAAVLLSSCATTSHVPPAAKSELAPTGKLRVGINVQNFLLVNKERSGGEYSGIAVDLGRELGRRLGVPVELVAFDTAGKLADAVKASAWDVAFLGNEPARASEIAFSGAYLEIEARSEEH